MQQSAETSVRHSTSWRATVNSVCAVLPTRSPRKVRGRRPKTLLRLESQHPATHNNITWRQASRHLTRGYKVGSP
eukprot:4553795-Amphidinium_carterae.1